MGLDRKRPRELKSHCFAYLVLVAFTLLKSPLASSILSVISSHKAMTIAPNETMRSALSKSIRLQAHDIMKAGPPTQGLCLQELLKGVTPRVIAAALFVNVGVPIRASIASVIIANASEEPKAGGGDNEVE